EDAGREPVAESHAKGHAFFVDDDLVFRRSPAHGFVWRKVGAARVDEKVRLLGTRFHVDTVEAERVQAVEDALPPLRLLRPRITDVELRDEVVAIDVDGERRKRIALFVHEAKGSGLRAGAPTKTPTTLDSERERAIERGVVVIHTRTDRPFL